jgi:anti-anti-sigma regulatory factor
MSLWFFRSLSDSAGTVREPRPGGNDAKEQAMPLVLRQTETASEIQLQGAADISLAAELKDILLQALSTNKQVRISLADTTALDATAAQLLWAAERGARTSGVAFALDGPVPETVSQALKNAGFDEFPVSA